MGKVGGRNRAEAIRAAEEKGWLWAIVSTIPVTDSDSEGAS
jgi:hypothetical protein